MENQDDVQSLLEQLAQAAKGFDKSDPVESAKMHGWSEALATATGPDASQPSPGLLERATRLTRMLESLIFQEAEDPDEVAASIVRTIAELDTSDALPPLEPDEKRAGVEPSDEEVAAKLRAIFEDESTPPPEAKATAPEAMKEPAAATEPPYEPVPLKINASEHEFLQGFLEEAGEHIEAIEAALLEVERSPEDAEQINTLFRPFHTIKGGAGFLNLRDINSLTHEIETLLDQARKGDRRITPGLIDLTFEVVDILKVQFAAIQSYLANPTDDEIPMPPIEAMIAGLRDVVAGRIDPVASQPTSGSPNNKVGENLVEQGAVPQEAVDFAVGEKERQPQGKKTGEALIAMGVATPKQVSQALRPQATQKPSTAGAGAVVAEQSIRIDTGKLDALVDMVGELVIAQTQVSSNPSVAANPKLIKDVTQATKIVRDVQDVAMAMRMIPIGPTFQKMARLVRDVSRKVGKHVELTISGEDTELDKNVIQQIGDPLIHMVRNAVDHGIESPDARRAAGKPETGQVHLSACHQGGNIVIDIRDDGKGLDPKSLIAKGIEKGDVQPGDNLTDEQAYQLVFAAGFSLAKEVTGISGRGVGMDVVRRNVEQLRGKVNITSQLGQGSTFTIRLPLTLAIIDGMVVRVGTERFIIQTVAIEQALRPRPEQITTVQHKGEILNVRGRLIPLVQLGSLFGLTERINPCDTIVVIAQYAGGEIGLVVEELFGQQQVVIKSLGERFQKLRGISGAAILGDGRVGLILEVSGIAAQHNAPRGTGRQSTPCVSTMPDKERLSPTDGDHESGGITADAKELVSL